MANFGTMTSDVSKRLIDPKNTAVSIADVQAAINQSIDYWKFRRFWFNEVNDQAVMTAGDNSFPYPDDFLVPVVQNGGFYMLFGNGKIPLIKIDEVQMDSYYQVNGVGLPRWYARMGDSEYQCYPTPDQNYVVGRHYLKDYVDLSADEDTNDFTDNATRLIELWAIANLVSELRQDTPGTGDYYRNVAQDEYRNLRVLTNKKNAAGQLQTFSQLNTGF